MTSYTTVALASTSASRADVPRAPYPLSWRPWRFGARDAAAQGRDTGEPGFVQEAYRAGQAVERLPGSTWRIAGTIYDATEEEVGW